MLRFWSFATLLVFGGLGCGRSGVTANDLVGTWAVTTESRQDYLPTEFGKALGQVVLNADGTFSASEVPRGMLGWYDTRPLPSEAPPKGSASRPESLSPVVAGSGEWKLTSRDGWRIVQLGFLSLRAGEQGSVPFSYGAELFVSGRKSSPVLFYWLGDPDDGRRVEFEKKEAKGTGTGEE